MPRILVLYHSTCGHIETMAKAIADGARSVEGAEVYIRRVPVLVPEEVAKSSGYKLDQEAPLARVDELPSYDAIIIGAARGMGGRLRRWPTSSTRRAATGRAEALVGKVGSAFSSTATQHGGQETTLTAIHTNLGSRVSALQ